MWSLIFNYNLSFLFFEGGKAVLTVHVGLLEAFPRSKVKISCYLRNRIQKIKDKIMRSHFMSIFIRRYLL